MTTTRARAHDDRHSVARDLAAGSAMLVAGSYWALMSPYSQLLGPFPHRAAAKDKVVALTFDDGPNEPYTSQIADFLVERDIRGTFFQVGACVERHSEVSIRLARDGHVIGNHGYSHQFRRCVGRTALRDDMRRAQRVFADRIGLQPVLYRPPWLLRTPSLFELLGEQSLQPVSGEFSHVLEVLQPAPQRIARRALAKARPGRILIFHDGFDAKGGDRANTVEAVKIVVAALSAQGYRFTTVDRLLGVPPYRMAPDSRSVVISSSASPHSRSASSPC